MCRLRHIFKNLLPGIIMLLSASAFAQEDKLLRAQQLLKAKNADEARLAIDSVILHPQTSSDFMSWTVRAYIYADIYRRTDKSKLHSSLRDTVISSIKISNNLKPDSSFKEQNKRLTKNIAGGYFNLARTLLHDSINYEHSLEAYNKYKELLGWVEPSEVNSKDIEYYLAVGSVYSHIFIKDNSNTKAGDIAKVALLKVLEIQPDNATANINMGLMYYNQAANLSKSLEFGADFDQIDIVQENMIKLGKQSFQFINKVYTKDNNNLKAIEALFYIYRLLNENAKSDEFKKIGMEKGIKYEPAATDKPAEGEKKENKEQQQNKEK